MPFGFSEIAGAATCVGSGAVDGGRTDDGPVGGGDGRFVWKKTSNVGCPGEGDALGRSVFGMSTGVVGFLLAK
jgi:hypothetical protein